MIHTHWEYILNIEKDEQTIFKTTFYTKIHSKTLGDAFKNCLFWLCPVGYQSTDSHGASACFAHGLGSPLAPLHAAATLYRQVNRKINW